MAGTNERSILARNVKALRLQRGMSQEELAAAAGGIRQAAVSEIEAAKGNPTFTTLEFVSAALGVTIRELLKA
ncbi:MAG: helix-turn-helix transcriptional regulator [Pseudomonadota bacterium]